ncbi:helix-turn-helix domain-containing protein [Streptomyces arenae]|uniref:helix-turn-helix domain-containing protein n=1 Tax=Streptomyces arenae TaxID=29301 RepID=UPI00265A0886|nr:XRE family transcriptional regulator [Streptomyces arenae]MCG7208567.1 XRE family transcriptional regulator [Streptomyces arenae]
MPRWKDLPDELDPQVKEFTTQLRRLVDRGGLSVAALSDRTGYSRTSWERYLGGRLLAPKGAIVALAEVTGTDPVHLTTMWELAERAWSRSEMRHDMTMEAIRISRARAALGEFGAPPATSAAGAGGKPPRRAAASVASPGIAGPAGVSPTIPPQPTAPDADRRDRGGAGGRGPAAPRRPMPPGGDRRRRLTMFLAGVVGVAVVVAGVLFLTDDGDHGKKNQGTGASATPSATAGTGLPAGVKCAGAGCTGKDAEAMGCSGDLVTTAKTAAVGTATLEVRYSRTCGAAWGRITGAARGDSVRVTAGTVTERGDITATGDTIAYTPMVAVKDAAAAKACATLASGPAGCTS